MRWRTSGRCRGGRNTASLAVPLAAGASISVATAAEISAVTNGKLDDAYANRKSSLWMAYELGREVEGPGARAASKSSVCGGLNRIGLAQRRRPLQGGGEIRRLFVSVKKSGSVGLRVSSATTGSPRCSTGIGEGHGTGIVTPSAFTRFANLIICGQTDRPSPRVIGAW